MGLVVRWVGLVVRWVGLVVRWVGLVVRWVGLVVRWVGLRDTEYGRSSEDGEVGEVKLERLLSRRLEREEIGTAIIFPVEVPM